MLTILFRSPVANRRAPNGVRRLGYELLEGREVLAASLAAAIGLPASGTDNYAEGYDIVVDGQGNRYVAATVAGSIDLDPTAAHPGDVDILASNGWGFIAKYDSAGAFQWARLPSSPNGGGLSLPQLDLDSAGNVIFSGGLAETVTFGSITLAQVGSHHDAVAGAISPSGDFLWATSLGSTLIENVRGAAVDSTGTRVVLAIQAMDSSPGTPYTRVVSLDVSNPADIQIAWSRNLPPSNWSYPLDVTVDAQGNVVTAGYFQKSIDFDPGNGVTTLASSTKKNGANSAAYIWKLNSAGSFVWARHFQVGIQGGESRAYNIASDAAGNLVVAGHFAGSVDFQPGSGTLSLPNAGGNDVFLAKLNAAGILQWARSYGGSGNDRVNDLALDAAGNLYVYGAKPVTGRDAFLAKYDASGTQQWTVALRGDLGEPTFGGVAIDPVTGKVHVLGSFVGGIDLDGDGDIDLDSGDSTPDLFWAMYDQV